MTIVPGVCTFLFFLFFCVYDDEISVDTFLKIISKRLLFVDTHKIKNIFFCVSPDIFDALANSFCHVKNEKILSNMPRQYYITKLPPQSIKFLTKAI